MLLLFSGRAHRWAGPPRAVALFGLGLIGGAILRSLHEGRGWDTREIPFPWAPGSSQSAAARTVLEAVTDAWDRCPVATEGRVDLVWAAGRAGFGAEPADTAAERQSFACVMDLFEALHCRRPAAGIAAHLVSSAGGLFEGQTSVGSEHCPAPRRPYGELKLAQERRLDEAAFAGRYVYRPTSVYGLVQGIHRRGLISTLVYNGLLGRVTRILCGFETLRDYVHVRDVGAFVAGRILQGAAGAYSPAGPFLLAAGKPTALHEVIGAVEAVLRRRVYLSLDYSPANSLDITFSSRALPEGWSPTDLATGVRLVHESAASRTS